MQFFTTSYLELRYKLRYFLFKCSPVFLYSHILNTKYYKVFSKKLNFKNPQKLTEKIQWLKLYEHNKTKAILADKLESKKYAKKLIPELNITKVYAQADSFKDINFNNLPNTFILKTNHAWKTNIIIDKSKLTPEKYKEYYDYYKQVLKINYAYWSYFEMQYKDIKPQIFAEEYIDTDMKKSPIIEYEVYCINGKTEFVRVSYSFIDKYNEECCAAKIFDRNCNEFNFKILFSYLKTDNINPQNIDKVVQYADILAKDLNFVRIDFMETNNKIYFLEMTFTPYSGFIEFAPEKYDYIYGKKLII